MRDDNTVHVNLCDKHIRVATLPGIRYTLDTTPVLGWYTACDYAADAYTAWLRAVRVTHACGATCTRPANHRVTAATRRENGHV